MSNLAGDEDDALPPLTCSTTTAQDDVQAGLVGKRILLVEDNELNQELAVFLLSEFKVVVDVAANGAVALDKLARADYDLVLMDMQMPVMDGLEATQEIRKQPRFAQLPVIAMTANAMTAERDRCLAVGMNDHIAKPIDPDGLYAMLVKWLPEN